ncbi:MAG: DNA-binding protein HU [Candidatus Dadabacteria bacterium]|nr:DNA-binding protein HU [Candidatus Dadabacteria bacterium]
MTKQELIEKMSNDAGISKVAAAKALDSITDSVKISLKKDKKVTLFGFGTFSASKRHPRIGRNPQTGEIIHIKASKTAKFKAGKALKEALTLYGVAFFIWLSLIIAAII